MAALKGHGHDLLGLLDALVRSVARVDSYATRPAVAELPLAAPEPALEPDPSGSAFLPA